MIQCFPNKAKTTIGSVLFMLISGLSCISCSKDSDSEPKGTYDSNYGLYVIDDGQDIYEKGDSYSAFNDTEEMIGKALNDYAVRMLIDYGNDNDNALLSPISASVLYSMMANFTDDNASNSFQEGMGISNYSMRDINSYCRKLMYRENTSGENLTIQNNIWINNNSSVYNSFLSMAKMYKAKVKGIEFGSTAGNTAMNNSIGNKMKNVDISKKSSWDGVNMAVTSSMYLEKKWKKKMTVSSTKYEFVNIDGSIYEGKMLISTQYARYANYHNFDILEIPYEGADYCLYIVYPHESGLLKQSLQELNTVGFVTCINTMKEEKVDIRIPKFKCEGLIDLNPSGKAAKTEIKNLFQTKLPKVSPSGFSLSDVYQACSMELNQEGMSVSVESSGIEVDISEFIGTTPGSGSSSETPKSKEFLINHPFAIFFRSSKLGVIVYGSCIKNINNIE